MTRPYRRAGWIGNEGGRLELGGTWRGEWTREERKEGCSVRVYCHGRRSTVVDRSSTAKGRSRSAGEVRSCGEGAKSNFRRGSKLKSEAKGIKRKGSETRRARCNWPTKLDFPFFREETTATGD